MNKANSNVLAKIIVFILLQIFAVSAVVSCLVVVVNAEYSWYTASKNKVKESMLSEIAMEVECEIHDGLYYELEFNDDAVAWPAYLLKDYELPVGIGYEIEFLKDKPANLSEIKLQKNVNKISGLDGIYKSEMYNDRYRLTVYVADSAEMGEIAQDIYPESLIKKYELMNKVYQYRNAAIVGLIVTLVLFVIGLVYLVSSIKKREDSAVSKIPFDIVLLAATIICSGIGAIMIECFNSYNIDVALLGLTFGTLMISIIITGTILLGAVDVKSGTWWKRSFICFVVCIIKKVIAFIVKKSVKAAKCFISGIKKVPLVWKTATLTAVVLVINFIIAINLSWSGFAFLCWIVGAILFCAGVIYTALCMKKIQDGGRRLAEGDLEYKIETKGLYMDFAEHASNLNSIGNGMAAAIKEKTKSERFKAELITNVSHDIKTPLTSIINYVDLLNKEDVENEKIKEYIEVLDRQSKRLKKLTEDLVDASKASTGNVKIDLAPCKIGLLMQQTMAEYKEKGEKNNLEFVMKLPEEEVEILADGRRLWRVLDNLLNNICKYAQPGTRVYMNLKKEDDMAVISYRNISRYELDITEEELMERFVRGDKSRNTEGSGLGLFIARNLVELQDGDFDISVDGDLFKVVIKFKMLNL